jgi:mannose-6-phosphate isomerase-like protein (cupin superfamily)
MALAQKSTMGEYQGVSDWKFIMQAWRRNAMRIVLARATLLTTAVLIGGAIVLGGGVPAAVHYIGHDKVTEVMSKGGPIVSDPGLVVLAQRREAGLVEYHDHTNHVFIMVEGEATLVVGGTMVGARRTGPDQMRAPSLEGGTTYHLSKGDVITIPAKTPHWFKEVPTKTVAYYAVNIESE